MIFISNVGDLVIDIARDVSFTTTGGREISIYCLHIQPLIVSALVSLVPVFNKIEAINTYCIIPEVMSTSSLLTCMMKSQECLRASLTFPSPSPCPPATPPPASHDDSHNEHGMDSSSTPDDLIPK
ncbi:hypothetical protein E2C01_086874 [Portunus trituberculatus]|uniref:Uncharacterized protein n=1 Tax=Portunus trituberculatus TaxID=210409 RepID=A0A5B7JHJ1_PORTR|nr:hypothetical protein [Portunus trituberculatus]